ncbi:MAG: thioredoxin-disulfide reductase [Ruminococcaceae bacterium]|nr:thioredoxin-disulfide reductase [Oscillospiraceae bacterium]
MEKYKDIIIIGGGPAGYTAAIYAGRAGLSSAVIEKMSPGGQMGITSEIENYPGFERVDGFDLASKMMAQAEAFGAEMMWGEVTAVELDGDKKIVILDGERLECGALMIATGAKPRYLEKPGEQKYSGRGVSYCATCDGMFFKGKTVVVNGGGDTAIEDALYLSNIAEKVYIVHRRDSFRAAASGVNRARAKENIEFVLESTVEEIIGDGEHVTAVILQNVVSGEKTELPCDGIFVAIGRIPETSMFAGQIDLDKSGYIVADETCRTNIEGVYAIGDVRTKPLRQIVTACADGATAMKYAEEYLSSKEYYRK